MLVKLFLRVVKDKVIFYEIIREVEMSGRNVEIIDNIDLGEKLILYELFKDVFFLEMEEIFEN